MVWIFTKKRYTVVTVSKTPKKTVGINVRQLTGGIL